MLVELLALTPQQNTLAIAVLIPVLGVLSPLLMAWMVNKNTRAQKKLDWEREDQVAARAAEVAERAAEVAALLVDRQALLDKKTAEVARMVETSTRKMDKQLGKIHMLVNSHYTEAIRAELAASQDTLAYMSELISSQKKAGVEPSVEVLGSYEGRKKKIAELVETLKVREKADTASQNLGNEPREVVVVNEEPVPVVETKES